MRRQTGVATALLLLGLGLGLSLIGCAGAGGGLSAQESRALQVGETNAAVVPPLGVLYSRVRAPATADLPRRVGARRGVATTTQIATPPLPGIAPPIPLIAWGDASLEEAAADGGIQRITHMDYQLTVILMIWRRFELIAYGD
ncbi:MAG: TRL domain-containing protein [bacterium]